MCVSQKYYISTDMTVDEMAVDDMAVGDVAVDDFEFEDVLGGRKRPKKSKFHY